GHLLRSAEAVPRVGGDPRVVLGQPGACPAHAGGPWLRSGWLLRARRNARRGRLLRGPVTMELGGAWLLLLRRQRDAASVRALRCTAPAAALRRRTLTRRLHLRFRDRAGDRPLLCPHGAASTGRSNQLL